MLHIIDIAVVIIIITILLIIFKFNYQKTLLPQVFVYSSTAHKVKESNFFQCNVQVSFYFLVPNQLSGGLLFSTNNISMDFLLLILRQDQWYKKEWSCF